MVWRKRNSRGVSLVEAALGIAVIAISALGAYSFLHFGRKALNDARDQRVAVRLAQEKVEELRAGAYADITAGTENGLTLCDITCDRTTAVTQGTGDAYREVSVTVSWGNGHDAALQTIIASSE